MSLKKNGEIKVFVSGDNIKNASGDNKVRYTVDDLVRDDESSSEQDDGDDKDVSE